MFKKIAAVLTCLFTVMAFSACSNSKQTNTGGNGKIKVSVSFNAMQEFVQAVGKEKVEISTINPGTQGCVADFEPKAQDLVGLKTAGVFVYNGLGAEPWAEKALKSVGNKHLIVVEASNGTDKIKNTDPDEIKENGQYDPHVWISLKGAQLEAQNIKEGLIKADPSDKDYFEKNCDSFVSQLESLYSDYKIKFRSVQSKSFVTGHAAFAYLCRDFGLKQDSVEDTFAEGEPSAQKLAELVGYCEKNNVKTIFVEDMVSPAVSQTLAKEVNAQVKQIYTIESTEENRSYLDRMKDNLEEIYGSLSQ